MRFISLEYFGIHREIELALSGRYSENPFGGKEAKIKHCKSLNYIVFLVNPEIDIYLSSL